MRGATAFTLAREARHLRQLSRFDYSEALKPPSRGWSSRAPKANDQKPRGREDSEDRHQRAPLIGLSVRLSLGFSLDK